MQDNAPAPGQRPKIKSPDEQGQKGEKSAEQSKGETQGVKALEQQPQHSSAGGANKHPRIVKEVFAHISDSDEIEEEMEDATESNPLNHQPTSRPCPPKHKLVKLDGGRQCRKSSESGSGLQQPSKTHDKEVIVINDNTVNSQDSA